MLPLYLLSIFLVGPSLAIESGSVSRIVARYSPREFVRIVALDRTTVMAAVPTFFRDLLELSRSERIQIDLRSLRIVTSGGAPMAQEVRDAFEARFGFRFLNVFGGTEAPGIVSVDPPDEPPRPGSVGRPLAHIHVCAIDKEWKELPPGQIGDLCTGPVASGPLAGLYEPMRGYWGDPEQSEEVLQGRTLRWGDVGYVDDDGFVFLVDRSNDVIIRGGMNIYPRQIETVICELSEVAEAAVVGVPHARYGEVPVAFITPAPDAHPDSGEVRAYVNRRVARYSQVLAVLVREDLPRNALGKVLKRELRDQLQAGLLP